MGSGRLVGRSRLRELVKRTSGNVRTVTHLGVELVLVSLPVLVLFLARIVLRGELGPVCVVVLLT